MTIEPPVRRRPSNWDYGRSAFSETSDPSAYVPRDATQSVLSDLEAWANDDTEGSTVGALIGPPGLGKTLLLRVFEARRRRRALYLPYAGLPPTELVDWIDGLLGRPSTTASGTPGAGHESERVLDRILDLAPNSNEPFFLLIDDADSMPAETLRTFVEQLPRERSTLRILMAMNEDAKASRLLAGFDSLRPRVNRLRASMSESETAHYLAGRLAWAGAPPIEIARLDAEQTRRIFALSAGVPQIVHRVAQSVFAGDQGAMPGDLDRKQQREDWMGRPFEDDS